MQEREKFKYRRATYKIRRRVFFSPTSPSSQESKGFFFRRATYKGTYVEAVEFRQGWSVAKNKGDVRKKRRRPRKVVCCHKKGTLRRFKKRKRPRKARRWLREGKVPVSSTKKFLFLVHEYLGSERPVLFEVSAPTRLSLRGSHV